jgi:integral membrane protein
VNIDQKFLRKLRTLGVIEGLSTLALFGIAMPLKYLADMPMAVTVVGSLHGVLFLALVAMFVIGMKRIPMPPSLTVFGIVGAAVPFGPFVVDHWLGKLGSASAAA